MQRLSCTRFPCHYLQQDCTFCFCPFYPCQDVRTGGRWDGSEWSCASCLLIHRPDVAEMVMSALMDGRDLKEIWSQLEAML